jgi:hypothetical protein
VAELKTQLGFAYSASCEWQKQTAGWLAGEVSTAGPHRRHMERLSLVTLLSNRKSQDSFPRPRGRRTQSSNQFVKWGFRYNMSTPLEGKILCGISILTLFRKMNSSS